METAIRTAALAAGTRVLGGLLEGIGCGRRSEPVVCSCGTCMDSHGRKPKPLLTILGMVPYERSMFECPNCGATRYPGDEELDVMGTSRSPGVRRMMARAGSRDTFKEGRDDLRVYAEIEVSAKDVERVAEGVGADVERLHAREREAIIRGPLPIRMVKDIPILYIVVDGTGIPVTAAEVEGRKGKQPDGSARTREVKLGCVFTQTTTNNEGYPIRDPDSTTFVGAIETAEEFGWRIYAEAVRRGVFRAKKVVVLGDGAEWIRNLVEIHFPGAVRIVDLYHVREHVSDLCKLLYPDAAQERLRHRMRWWTDLDDGNIEKIIREAREHLPASPAVLEEAEKEIAYLDKRTEQMRYADFRAAGLFVGSGVIEAGCKTVIGKRLKQSGMEWSVRGANSIIALRCAIISDRFEDYWEARSA